MRIFAATLIVCLVALSAQDADAQIAQLKPSARARLDRGLRLFEEKRYDEAMRELRRGYAISDAREFLYAMGQIERIRGRCAAAKTLYQDFLATNPAPEQATAARLQIDRCEPSKPKAEPAPAAEPAPVEKPAAPPLMPPAPTTAPAADPAPVIIAPPPPAGPGWYTDILGGCLLGGGALLAGSGIGLFVAGGGIVGGAEGSLAAYERARGALWMQPVGLTLIGVSAALITGAIIRYVIVAKRLRVEVAVGSQPFIFATGEF